MLDRPGRAEVQTLILPESGWLLQWHSGPATLHMAGERFTIPFTEPFYRRDLA